MSKLISFIFYVSIFYVEFCLRRSLSKEIVRKCNRMLLSNWVSEELFCSFEENIEIFCLDISHGTNKVVMSLLLFLLKYEWMNAKLWKFLEEISHFIIQNEQHNCSITSTIDIWRMKTILFCLFFKLTWKGASVLEELCTKHI